MPQMLNPAIFCFLIAFSALETAGLVFAYEIPLMFPENPITSMDSCMLKVKRFFG